ncbi:MAG: IS4 family transposase [Candidatus Erginobacter occultus]|nr:IS4 family transposase [Candidatus Erginobacter occultus]
MKTQNQIKRNLGRPEVIEHIKNILTDEGLNQYRLAKILCQEYDFHDARGKPQLGSCSTALKELERQGFLTLPAPRQQTTGGWNPRRLGKAVAEAKDVPDEVTEIKDLRLVRVKDEKQMRIWNELTIREHPQGHRPLVGRQLRYLIKSEYGWLGALGFAAAALQLKDRDKWIGWNLECRRAYLENVVGLGRFLIRNQVHCRNLASRVLSICTRQMPEDFEELYGYRPWLLESFVDRSKYSGACYRAANWLRIGQTQGRGRQDRNVEHPETVKDIYVYVLNDDFRRQMGLAKDAGLTPLRPEDGLDEDDWAENEFGAAPIGDERLSKRLVEVAQVQGQNPGASWLKACRGDRAAAKGYYRMIDNPEEDKITMAKILQPHRERTIRRLKGQQVVLFVSDGSDLDFSNLEQCEGLGVVGKNQTSKVSRGLHLHSTLAYTGNGLPLGIMRAQCYAPEPKPENREKDRRQIPIEEKKSFRWIEDLRDCVKVVEDIPNISAVSIMDREADFFELFDEWRKNPRVDLLVRAQHNRRTGEDLKLFDMVSQTPVKFRMQIDISRRSARSKKGKRPAQTGRKARRAEVAVRYTPTKICPPNFGLNKSKEPVPVWFIHLVEENPPQGEEPLEWRLITTIELDSREKVLQCISWYRLRWRIEDWHRVLKTGCRVEALSHKTADRLRRAIALKLVIAWRIMLLTLLGREAPHLPATVMFTDIEIEVLKRYALKKKLNSPLLMGEAVILVGRLGGYLGRGKDPPPGYEVLWKGYSDLQTMCMGFELANIECSPD